MAFGARVACALLLAAAHAAAEPVVREERTVVVDGVAETWRLEWRGPPAPACAPDDPVWFTCPCMGFAFGEHGVLDLVRLRSGSEPERLPLTPFFAGEETPAWNEPHAVLRRWPVIEGDDFERLAASLELRRQVYERRPASILDVADWNRDGWSTEFLLQVGTLPCGKRRSLLVGLSRARPQLHAFGTAAHPERPLVLYAHEWEKLMTSSGPLRVVAWRCGDHESAIQTEHVLHVDAAGIHVVEEEFSCDQGIRLERRSRERP